MTAGLFVAILVVVGIVGVYALDGLTDDPTHDADGTPILTVDGRTVTYQDYQYELRQSEATLATMKEAVAGDPDQGELTPQQEASQREWIETIERVGVRNVAMGSLIAETATYQWALSEGYGASDAEIADAMEEQERLHERMAGTQAAATQQLFIDEVGEDRFWNEILPREMEREIVFTEARLAVMRGEHGADAGDSDAWADLQVDLVRSAEIEIHDSDKVDPETVERGREYIVENYADLQTRLQGPQRP